MDFKTPTTITISDRNEAKALHALGFVGVPAPRDAYTLDFIFDVSEELFTARRGYSLNAAVPVLSFVAASRLVDAAIVEHRRGGAR